MAEAPLVHAADHWDPLTRVLTYTYNNREIMRMVIPGTSDPGYRHTSDGDLQGWPFYQQLYFMLDEPTEVEVVFTFSAEALNMRPHRALARQAIRGQAGRPLTPGINGLYDITQDLLIDWNGLPWAWEGARLTPNADGDLVARLKVTLGPKPWFVNVRPHYYRTHLGYAYHRPWARRPNTKPVSGWCSWEAYRRDVSQDDVTRAAKQLGASLRPYGLEYIQLDDGYEPMPVPAVTDKPMPDSWLATNDRFPGGHSAIVQSVREEGLEPGVWTCSAIINEAFAEAHRAEMLTDTEGTLITGDWCGYLLDGSPASLEKHVRPIYEGMKAAGYSYLKIDGIRHLLYDGLQKAVAAGKLSNDEAERLFRTYIECVRGGLGDDVYLLSSWGILSQVVGLADACRISMDANPTWAGVRMQLVETARWFHAQRILFTIDPDHICARASLEWTRSVSSLVSLSGGLFMLSDPLETYEDPARLDVLRRCLPPVATFAGETGPLDVSYPAFTWTKLHGFAVPRENVVAAEEASLEDALNMAGDYPTMHEDHPFGSLWSFHFDQHDRQWHVVARFATVPLKASMVSFESTGLEPESFYHVFDFWAQRYLGVATGAFECPALDLGHCQILAFTPLQGRPQIVGSSRHVSVDAVSILREHWENSTLNLTLAGVPGTTENYWVHVPEGYTLGDVRATGASVACEKGAEALVCMKVAFKTSEATVVAAFI
jgi:hypothetical protein